MAIKGKNKSKSRSGKPRSRPAAAGRPVARGPQRVPWYKTMAGQLTLILVALAVVGVAIWAFSARSARAAELEDKQEQLRGFTSEIDPIVTSVQQTVAEMLGAPFNNSDPSLITGLEESTQRWVEDLEGAAALTEGLVAPDPKLEPATLMIQQAMMLYRSAALTYELVPSESGGKRQQKLLDRATDQRDAAGRVLGAGIQALDAEREEVEMGASGIQNLGTLAPIVPSAEPSGSPAPGDADDGDPNDGRSGRKNGNRDSDG